MGYVYFGALIVALGVLVLQLALSHSGGSHGLAEAHVDQAGDTPGGSDIVASVLSTRFWVFATLGFGLSGFLLHVLALASVALTAGLAVGMGLGSGAFAAYAFRFVARNQVSSSVNVSTAVGRVGRVLVACTREQMGQIRVDLKGQSVDLLATTDDAEIPRGASVLVVDVRESVAHVSRAPAELE